MLFVDISVLLEGLTIHVSVGEVHIGDYADHVSNQSQFNSMQGVKSLPSMEAFRVRTIDSHL